MVNGDHQLPDGWTKIRLGDVTPVLRGASPRPKGDPKYYGGDIPWIKISDVTGERGKFLTQTVDTVTEAGAGKSRFLKKGSLILSICATVCVPKILLIDGCIHDGFVYFPSLPKDINQNFLYYYFGYIRPQVIHENRQGMTQVNLNTGIVSNFQIPVPPLPEQERIVAKIEELFTQLEAGTSALAKVQAGLRRYRASVLKAACEGHLVFQDNQEGFAKDLLTQVNHINSKSKKRAGRLWGSGSVPEISEQERERIPQSWVWAKVKDLGSDPEETVQVGPMSMQSKDFEDDGVPVLNVGCVQWGYFVESKLNYLPMQKAAEFGRYRIRTGDILFTRSGTVGRCAVARDRQNGWLMTFHLLRVRPDPKKCMPDYLQIVFEGASHIRKQTRDASIGTTRAGFNTNLLAMLDIPLPPLEEQRRIVAEVERRLSVARQVESSVEEALVRASRLRQAVLRSAFEGML